MANPANIRETRIALGFKKQTAPQVINQPGEYVSFTKINAALNDVRYNSETDAADIGKGNEFALTNFKTSIDVTGSIEKILSSQFAAWAFGFGLGKVTTAAAGTGTKYTATIMDPVADGIEMPGFTVVEAIRQGGSAVLDRAMVGCVINELTLSLKSGPGRQNAMLTAAIMGTGVIVDPSTVTLPDSLSEAFLNAASATITINDTDYVSGKSFVSLDMTIRNAVRGDTGYYPGSGVSAEGFQVRGRMEHGDREVTLMFVARFAHGSDELTKLKNVSSGTTTITVTGGAVDGTHNHTLRVTFPKLVFRVANIADDAGIVTVHVECTPFYDAVNGLISVEVTTDLAAVMTAGVAP